MTLRICIVLALLSSGACARKQSETGSARKQAAKTEAPVETRASAPPRFERVAAPLVAAAPPASVPVEEDFISEAAERITRRSNLEAELERLSREIASP